MKVTADDDNRLPPGRTPRVLVVDDEESLRELLELTLVGMGLDVDVAEDLSTARAMLERYPGLAGVIMGVPWAHQLFAAPVAQACQVLVDGGLGVEEAGVVLDFVGDTVISTHAQIEVMRSPSAPSGLGGPTGLEETSRFAAAAGNPPLPEALTPNESWLERGGLDRKIEIIIRGVAAGLPPGATDTGGKSASGGDVSGRR